MSWTGRLLIIPGGVSSLLNPNPRSVPHGVRLAIEGAPKPFIDASDALINNHFITGQPVRISGRSEPAGAPTLIFMTNVERIAEAAGHLPMGGVGGAAKKGGAKKGGAKKAAKKGSSTKSTAASRKSGKKAPAKSTVKKSAGKKSASKKSTKKSARKGGKKQR